MTCGAQLKVSTENCRKENRFNAQFLSPKLILFRSNFRISIHSQMVENSESDVFRVQYIYCDGINLDDKQKQTKHHAG